MGLTCHEPGRIIGALLWTGGLPTLKLFQPLLWSLIGAGVAGALFFVLNQPLPLMGGTSSDLNNNSTALRLSYGQVSFLLTGDLESDGELALLDRGANIRSTVLEVAHHGSGTSSSAEFLSEVQPDLMLVSVAADNLYGNPSPEVMARLADAADDPARVLTTGQAGDITLVSEGLSLRVQTRQ